MRLRAAWALPVTLAAALSAPQPGCVQSARANDISSDSGRARFLRQAEIVSSVPATTGSTKSRRVTLREGEFTHDAHVQTVDVRGWSWDAVFAFDVNFIDTYRSNLAAYQLDRLLGLEMIPVTVQRDLHGMPGSFAWWVDGLLFTERERVVKRQPPPNWVAWDHQIGVMRVFDQLIGNNDRNLDNILIDHNWKLWMIDHSRAFRADSRIGRPGDVMQIDRVLFVRMTALERHEIEGRLGQWLSSAQIDALLTRRDRIVASIEQRLKAKGAKEVFYDWLRDE